MNTYNNIYEILLAFEKSGSFARETIAEGARMEKEILDTLIVTNQEMMVGTFSSIAKALQKLKNEADRPEREKLQSLYADFIDFYAENYPEHFKDIANPYFTKSLIGLAEDSQRKETVDKVNKIFGIVSETESPEENEAILSDIKNALAELNEKGRKEAVRRIRELSFVPEYRK